MKKVLILALLLYDVVESNRRAQIIHRLNRDKDIDRNRVYSDDERMLRKKAIDIYDLRRTWEAKKDSIEKRMAGSRRNAAAAAAAATAASDRDSSFEDQDTPPKPNRSGEYSVDETRKQMDPPSGEKDNNNVERTGKGGFQWDCDRDHERYESCFAGCSSITCDNPRERLKPCYPFCEAGCICVPPYVRDDRTHKCVRPEDCSKGLKGIPDLNLIDEIAL